jgi:Tfp pilus assembly protein PilX
MPGRRHAQYRNQRGSVLMIALLVMIVLSLLGVALLTLSGTEHNIAYNALWSEGAFAAADAGIQTGLNQLSANSTTSTAAIPVTAIGTGTYTYQFRSGHRADPGPQPLVFKGSRIATGYSLAIGTGYNPSGYAFNSYQINATGSGPRNAQREIEVLAEYGPVAQ